MGRRLTQEEFVNRANLIHHGKYDYSNTVYLDYISKIVINCLIHGDFLQSPSMHLFGNGCPSCGGTKRRTTKSFIEKAIEKHGCKYDYSKVDYKNNRTNVIIVCKQHGEFLQSPKKHLVGHECHSCVGGIRSTTELFIEKAIEKHGCKYDYSKVDYKNNRTCIVIVCKKHGEFLQSPHDHLRGNGCRKCNESHGERLIGIILNKKNIKFEQEVRFKSCKNIKPLPFDFMIKLNDKFALIEYQGEQHYKSIKIKDKSKTNLSKIKKMDLIKFKWCHDSKIPFLTIPYWDYKNIENRIDEFLYLI